jgi:hypothetical protein
MDADGARPRDGSGAGLGAVRGAAAAPRVAAVARVAQGHAEPVPAPPMAPRLGRSGNVKAHGCGSLSGRPGGIKLTHYERVLTIYKDMSVVITYPDRGHTQELRHA